MFSIKIIILFVVYFVYVHSYQPKFISPISKIGKKVSIQHRNEKLLKVSTDKIEIYSEKESIVSVKSIRFGGL